FLFECGVPVWSPSNRGASTTTTNPRPQEQRGPDTRNSVPRTTASARRLVKGPRHTGQPPSHLTHWASAASNSCPFVWSITRNSRTGPVGSLRWTLLDLSGKPLRGAFYHIPPLRVSARRPSGNRKVEAGLTPTEDRPCRRANSATLSNAYARRHCRATAPGW